MNFLYSRNNRKFHTVLSGQKCPDFFTSINPSQLTKVSYNSVIPPFLIELMSRKTKVLIVV